MSDVLTTTGNSGPSAFGCEDADAMAVVVRSGTRAVYVMEDKAIMPRNFMENFMMV